MSFTISLKDFCNLMSGSLKKLAVMPVNEEPFSLGQTIKLDVSCEYDDVHCEEFREEFVQEVGRSATTEELNQLDQDEFSISLTIKEITVWPDIETVKERFGQTVPLPTYDVVAQQTERPFRLRDFYSHFVLVIEFFGK